MDEHLPPILQIAFGGTVAWLREAIYGGADLKVRTANGVTPLIAAMSWQQYDMARELIRAGCDSTGIGVHYATVLQFEQAADSPEFRASLDLVSQLCERLPAVWTEPRFGGPAGGEIDFRWPGCFLFQGVGDASRLVLNRQAELLGRGALLVARADDVLLLAPTPDKYALIAMLGSAADAEGDLDSPRGTPARIATLLEAEVVRPFRLLRISAYELFLDFGHPIPDPAGLAAILARLPCDVRGDQPSAKEVPRGDAEGLEALLRTGGRLWLIDG